MLHGACEGQLVLKWSTGYNFCYKRSFGSWAAGSSCRHAEVSMWVCSLRIRSVQNQRDEKHRSPTMTLHVQAGKHRWNNLDQSFLGRGLYIQLGLEDVFWIVLLFVNISIHLVLRNNFKCESPFWNLYAQLLCCTLAVCMSVGVDRDLDQTTVGCASELVPDWALLSDQGVSVRLGRSLCCSCALVCRTLNDSVEEEATWHLDGQLPLLKSPEALIEKHKNHGKLFGQTYQSDSAVSELQPLPQESGVRIGVRHFPCSGWRLKPRAGTFPLLPLPALGAAVCDQARCLLTSRTALLLSIPVEYWLFFF